MRSATSKCGGVYLYANHRGCDGTRLYFDGCALVYLNGQLLVQATQFSLREVEVVTAVVDLNDVRAFRSGKASFLEQASNQSVKLPTIDLGEFSVASDVRLKLSIPMEAPKIHSPEEECALGPACWLWDYLRRSGAGGFLLPLRYSIPLSIVRT